MYNIGDKLISFFISFLICSYLVISFGLDVFSITLACGFISCGCLLEDVVKVFKGEVDIFDPSVLIAGVGIFILLISPVSQLYWDYWPYLPSMGMDLGWVNLWALLNLSGVLIYVSTKNKTWANKAQTKKRIYFVYDAKFIRTALTFLLITFVAQVYIYISFGGVSGFIEAFTSRQEQGVSDGDPFSGMGMIMLVAESFKVIFAIFVIFLVKKYGICRSNGCFFLLMLALLLVFLFFGGLRGSRSSTLFPLIFAAGMYHFWVRNIDMKVVSIGIVVVLMFSTSYYWYKIAGTNGIEAIFDSSLRSDFHESRVDADKYLIARDLGRMDFQSLALKRIYEEDFPLSFGRTYLVSMFSVLPKQIIPYKPDQITKEKTELIYGQGSYNPDSSRQTTLVLGQAGESLVNFGVVGVLIFYFLLGRIVYWWRSLTIDLHTEDIRRFFLPIISFVPVLLIITDMNVVIYQLVRYLSLPLLMIWLCVRVRD